MMHDSTCINTVNDFLSQNVAASVLRFAEVRVLQGIASLSFTLYHGAERFSLFLLCVIGRIRLSFGLLFSSF
jgi:hypothetical protein